jgi:hypothetical protein
MSDPKRHPSFTVSTFPPLSPIRRFRRCITHCHSPFIHPPHQSILNVSKKSVMNSL